MKSPTKTWRRPQLTVLTRTAPEEAVLGGCKHESHGDYHAPAHDHYMCGYFPMPCALCSVLVSS